MIMGDHGVAVVNDVVYTAEYIPLPSDTETVRCHVISAETSILPESKNFSRSEARGLEASSVYELNRIRNGERQVYC